MATGNELILGYLYNDRAPFLKGLGIKELALENDLEDLPSVKAANEALVQAHHNACLELGWKFKEENGLYQIFETPLGIREFSPFRLDVHYDPGEMGEELKHAVLGVAVSSRYFPTFVDWEDPSGTIWNIVCDPQQPLWVVAKHFICKALPWMKNAQWIVKEKFY